MDGENNGKPYEQMDDLGGFPIFLVQHPNGFPKGSYFNHWFSFNNPRYCFGSGNDGPHEFAEPVPRCGNGGGCLHGNWEFLDLQVWCKM